MAKIKNYTLTPALTQQLLREIEFLPDDGILTYGKDCLPGGFTKAKAIRERLASVVQGAGPLSPALISLLAYSLPFRSTVDSLSSLAIRALFAPLSVLLGFELLLLLLLVDEREDVNRFAGGELGRPHAPTTREDEDKARAIVAGFIDNNFLIPAGIEDSSRGTPVADRYDGAIDVLERAAAEQEREVTRLKQAWQEEKNHGQARLKKATDEAERERKQLIYEREQVRAKLEAALQEKAATEARWRAATAQMEAAIAQGVQEQTATLTRKWLEAPLAVQRAVAQPPPKDLLERAQAALAKQAAQDQHVGHRLELERRSLALAEAKSRLVASLQNAILPVAELKPLIEELDTEMGRLQKLLGGPPAGSELTTGLITLVNTSEDWDDLRRYGQALSELADWGLLSSADKRTCYHALHRKLSLLEERGKPRGREVDTGWSLRDALFRNKPTLLVLDGHNLLFGLPDLFAAEYENDHPGRRARQKLTSLLEKLVGPRSAITTKICYDGPSAEVLRVGPNLEVHFSGGVGRDRADTLIVSRLQFKDIQTLDQRVFVVTDDRAVRRQILQTGAKYVPNDLFAVLLADFQCLK